MPPVDQSILDKLQKILSLAARGGTEAEAQAAMAAAQRLAIQHNIDLAQVGERNVGPRKMETDRAGLKMHNKYKPYSQPIAWTLQACFDVSFIWVGGTNPCVVGEKTDVQMACYCWAWLNEMLPRLFRTYCEDRGMPLLTGIPRVSYYEGVCQGISENNRRQREEVRKTADAQSFALVLVKKEELVQARVELEFPKLRQARAVHRTIDNSVWSAGHAEGRKIKLNGGLAGGANQGRLS
jgi:hypothetical protein